MPRVRPSVKTPARVALLVLSVVAAVSFAPSSGYGPPVSRACFIAMPKPLRALYGGSKLVAVARAGESVAVSDEGAVRQWRTALRLDTILKGESKEKVIKLFHHVAEEGTLQPALSKGDVLLVFLEPREEGDGYAPADTYRGIKKLQPDELKVYLRRIEELAAIVRAEKPDPAALTEWLVRCAEEPATRWEGAADLGYGATLPADPEEAVDQKDGNDDAINGPAVAEARTAQEVKAVGVPAGQTAGGDEAIYASVNETGFIIDPPGKADESVDFAALLTPAQKERLTTTLLGVEEFDEGDQMLLTLVGSWKDARLVPFCLKFLARMADKPGYDGEDLMRIVAHTLGDRTLIKFVADYSDSASYEDLYEEDVAEADGADDGGADAAARAANRKEAEEKRAAAAEALFQRSGKLRHFLALAEQPQKQP